MWVLWPIGAVVLIALLLDLIPKRRRDLPPKRARQAWAGKRIRRA